jgi:hypothetical protein
MVKDPLFEKRFVRIGAIAGLTGCLMYGVRSAIHLPGVPGRLLFLLFGPVLVVAFVGVFPFMIRHRLTIAAILGSIFGVLGSATNMMFAAVQLNNLVYIRGYLQAATSEAERGQWRQILNGVFTVQSGLNYVADFFFDLAIFFWAALMWRHPKFGKAFTVAGIVAGGFHFGMKLVTFPRPPAEAGLFDAGPLIGIWYAAVSISILWHLGWLEPGQGRAQVASSSAEEGLAVS